MTATPRSLASDSGEVISTPPSEVASGAAGGGRGLAGAVLTVLPGALRPAAAGAGAAGLAGARFTVFPAALRPAGAVRSAPQSSPALIPAMRITSAIAD